jgi:hypothetical protein
LYGGRYFITSDKIDFSTEDRRYFIREYDPTTGEVGTPREGGAFNFIEDARARCREMIRTFGRRYHPQPNRA